MIRSFYGLTHNPFDARELELLPQQREIYDTLKVHCQQGGLCLVLGVPGTGKSVIKQSLQRLPESQHLVATVGRTLHTYTNTVKILCDACRVEFDSSAFKCERRLIEQAFSLNHAGKSLTIILDDAHLMDLANLRPGQFPDRGPPRSGLGDFHHPAPPWVRLTASHPRSAP
jgi:type II secretory pathway predicted ATPase ExeA